MYRTMIGILCVTTVVVWFFDSRAKPTMTLIDFDRAYAGFVRDANSRRTASKASKPVLSFGQSSSDSKVLNDFNAVYFGFEISCRPKEVEATGK